MTPSTSARGGAIAAMYEQAAMLAAAGDLAAARALHTAIGSLLGDATHDEGVIDLGERRKKR